MRRHPQFNRRGSVIVIVLVTLMFATYALIAFMEKATVDLLVEQREAVTRRLRMEAYTALETTLSVLEEFREAGQGLRSPSEGWGDPLTFAGYVPSEGRSVQVTFEDESGKISLPRVNAQILVNLFKNWGILQTDAEGLADALLGWMRRDHVYSSSVMPNYDQGPLPFEPPRRSLRSFHELAAIEKVREFFYDSDGRPNEYWKRFADSVSLLNFPQSNLNGAKPDTLAALGQFDEQQQQNIGDYLRGTGTFQRNGPGFFQNPTDAQRVAGPTGNAGQFAATISALRIVVTVRDGRTEFRMATVVAPQGSSAQPVQETATAMRTETSAKAAQATAQQGNRPSAVQNNNRQASTNNNPQTPNARNLKYPFTLLEMRENDEIPAVPLPPPDPSLI
jgi:hypothetical protein